MSVSFTITSNQSIEELITMIASDIEAKRNLVSNLRNEYSNNVDCNKSETIIIKRFTLLDLIDEFDITISQSLQAIQTLHTEIYNLKETIDQANEEIVKQKQLNQSMNNRDLKEKQLSFDYSRIKEYNAIIEKTNEELIQMIKKQDLNCNTNNKKYKKEEEKQQQQEEQQSDKGIQYDIKDWNFSYTEEIHIPIKQSIRQIIKCPSKREHYNSSNNNDNKQFPIKLISHNMNNEFERIKKLLSKIGMIDTYRLYLGDKYGNGDYEQFIQLVNNKEIDYSSLEEELKILAEIMAKQMPTTLNLTSTTSINNNNNYMANTSRQLNKAEIATKTSQSRNLKEIQKHIKSQKSYVEPLKFDSYLRNYDNKITKNKPMSFSTEKRYI